MERSIYSIFSRLFSYPDADYNHQIESAKALLEKAFPELLVHYSPFYTYVKELNLADQQELFLRSFDVQAVTTLDIGYVLFGDDYKRGELLVNLNREHRESGNECGTELSDNLANVLNLMPKLKDPELAYEFAVVILGPAIKRMSNSFNKDQVNSKDKFYQKQYKTLIDRPVNNYCIYQYLLNSIYMILDKDYHVMQFATEENGSDFLNNIYSEAKIEG